MFLAAGQCGNLGSSVNRRCSARDEGDTEWRDVKRGASLCLLR